VRHKMRSTIVLMGALFLFAGGVVVQGQTTQDQSQPGMMGTAGGMMGMMGKMKGNQQQMFHLMQKLMTGMKAIEDEKDPAALKSKLAEHQALLNHMHAQMTQQGIMMSDVSGMMQTNCSMMGDDASAQNVMGIVKAISANSLTVETMDTAPKSVTVSMLPSTKFIKDGADTSAKDLKVEDRVVISVKPNGDKFEAVKVVFGQMFQHMGMHHN
jgi:hypothetical protein